MNLGTGSKTGRVYPDGIRKFFPVANHFFRIVAHVQRQIQYTRYDIAFAIHATGAGIGKAGVC